MKYFIAAILCLISFNSNAFANWDYDESSKSIYSVYIIKDDDVWNSHIIVRVMGDEISFIATVPFSEYQEVFTKNLPTILNYQGKKLVGYDTFFWGEKGRPESIKIDGESFDDFYKSNNNEYQILNSKNSYSKLIESFQNGNKIILDKHYWKKNSQKAYPSFSLIGFTRAYNKYIEGNKQSKAAIKEFDPGGVRCKRNGKRIAVWINTDHGTYALNGTAMTWFNKTKEIGYPLIGSDGKDWKMGIDHIDTSIISTLIQSGLKKCDGQK